MSENMTATRLSGLHILRREITRTKKRLAALKNQKCQSAPTKRAIKNLEQKLEEYLIKSNEEAAELLNYISSIDDLTVREIFMLRYYDGMRSWQRIAFNVGEHDESFVRRKHNAYLKKHE